MVSHERPCASAALRSWARPSRNSVMLLGDACQPSPRVTTRRNAAGLAPPTQIGGWGFWTGFGAKPRSRNRKNSPSKLGESDVHSSLKTRKASSAWRPRVWKGAPRISSSSFHHPTPNPQMRRPFDSASMLASILAMSTGWRWPKMNTDEPSRARVVQTAAAARAVTASRYGRSGGCGKLRPRP